MTVSEFTEGFGFIESGIKVFEGIDSRAATRKGSVRLLVCCEDILKEKERSLSRQASLFDLFKLF
jgi:hypothetical protein